MKPVPPMTKIDICLPHVVAGRTLIPGVEHRQVSRMKVRRSLDELVRPGLMIRQRGRGAFVSDEPVLQPVETIRATVADTELAEVLVVEKAFPILHIRLIMHAGEQSPIALTDLFFRGDMYEHRIRLAGLGR